MEHFGQPIAGAFAREDKVTQPQVTDQLFTGLILELGFSHLVFPTTGLPWLF